MVTHDACWRRSSNDVTSAAMAAGARLRPGRPLSGATLLHYGKRGCAPSFGLVGI